MNPKHTNQLLLCAILGIMSVSFPLSSTAAANDVSTTNSDRPSITTPVNLRGRWFGSNKAGARQFTKIGKHYLLIARYMYFPKQSNQLHGSNYNLNIKGVTLFSPSQHSDQKLSVQLKGIKNDNLVYQLAPHAPLYWTEKISINGKYQTVLKSLFNGQIITSTKKPLQSMKPVFDN